MFKCKDLDQFLGEYGDLLADKARQTLTPLHVPSRDKPNLPTLFRSPFEAQAHCVEAIKKQWRRAKAVLLVAEMGTGKTFMSMAAVHASQMAKAINLGYYPAQQSKRTDLKVIDVDPWTEMKIRASHCRVHDKKMAGAKTFEFGGEVWAADGASSQGTPGVSNAWRIEHTGYRVMDAAAWRGPVMTFEEVYRVMDNPDREVRIRKVNMGALAISGLLKKKPVVFHSPVVFRCACPRPYRTVVVCPGQLTEKWTREIVNTVPGAIVYQVESYAQILKLAKRHARYKHHRQVQERRKKAYAAARARIDSGEKLPFDEVGDGNVWTNGTHTHTREQAKMFAGNRPMGPEYYIIGRDCLKLSCGWKPVYRKKPGRPGCFCPKCGQAILKKSGNEEVPVGDDYFIRNGKPTARRKCLNKITRGDGTKVDCGEQLWQETDKPKKYSPARLIQKKLKGFFDVGVIDEAHEYKSGDSLQGDAIGAIAGSCKKIAALTGTLVGGYAWHVRTLLFRIGGAATLIEEGLGWKDEMEFNRKFGRIETKTTISANAKAEENIKGHSLGRGGKKGEKTTSYVRPGIMPTLFKHLLGQSVFLGLAEVADNLPEYHETPVSIEMDPDQAAAYELVDSALTNAIKDLIRKGNRKMLGVMLNCLLCYPDYAYDWGEIGYWEDNEDGGGTGGIDGTDNGKTWVHVVTPENLDPSIVRPKEQAAVDYALDQKALGRQTWIYVCYTDKRDCIKRLERFMKSAGLKVAVMRSTVSPKDRERWIEENGPKYDVVLSHPQLVQTGLDFFSPIGQHNFCSILFYQTGYNLFTLMQAARRAWRIGQKMLCEVSFLYYEGTMQARAMALMGKKMMAARNLNGQFSAEGLAAMAGDDAGLEMELAKSLSEAIPENDQIRSWAKVSANGRVAKVTIVREVEDNSIDSLPDLDATLFDGMEDFDFDGEEMEENLKALGAL